MRDLQVASHLAWFDRDLQVRDPLLRDLLEKGRGYSEEDKARLAERERELLRAVVPAYRRAAEGGQIELSTTPYFHPILPLLCDTDAHREAHPGAAVPRRFVHPEDAASIGQPIPAATPPAPAPASPPPTQAAPPKTERGA